MNRLQGNLIEPLNWTDWGECQNFAKNHRCYCGGSLTAVMEYHPGPRYEYYVRCTEHGRMYEHSVIHQAQAERMVDNQRSGAYELRKDDPPEHTEEENLKALGF